MIQHCLISALTALSYSKLTQKRSVHYLKCQKSEIKFQSLHQAAVFDWEYRVKYQLQIVEKQTQNKDNISKKKAIIIIVNRYP